MPNNSSANPMDNRDFAALSNTDPDPASSSFPPNCKGKISSSSTAPGWEPEHHPSPAAPPQSTWSSGTAIP